MDAKSPDSKGKAFLICSPPASSAPPFPSNAEGNYRSGQGTHSQESWGLNVSEHCQTNWQCRREPQGSSGKLHLKVEARVRSQTATGGRGCRFPQAQWCSSVQFSLSAVSDSLQPHEPQHARPPCPSPTPRVHPNPCPLSR